MPGRVSRNVSASFRLDSRSFSSFRFASPKFFRHDKSSDFVAASVSRALTSGVPRGVGSPSVKSTTPTDRPASRQTATVPPTLISASSGCGATTSTSRFIAAFSRIVVFQPYRILKCGRRMFVRRGCDRESTLQRNSLSRPLPQIESRRSHAFAKYKLLRKDFI